MQFIPYTIREFQNYYSKPGINPTFAAPKGRLSREYVDRDGNKVTEGHYLNIDESVNILSELLMFQFKTVEKVFDFLCTLVDLVHMRVPKSEQDQEQKKTT